MIIHGFICWHGDSKCLRTEMREMQEMIIQAELRRKQSEYEGEACVIDKVIELPAPAF